MGIRPCGGVRGVESVGCGEGMRFLVSFILFLFILGSWYCIEESKANKSRACFLASGLLGTGLEGGTQRVETKGVAVRSKRMDLQIVG